MIMQAIVIDVQWEWLLVLDLETRQRVLVHTPDARRFRPGELVLIWYSGAMTRSIPPQISAFSIVPMPPEAIRPPAVRPPVIFPPVIRPPMRPPVERPPARPPTGRPPMGRPPMGRPGQRPRRDWD